MNTNEGFLTDEIYGERHKNPEYTIDSHLGDRKGIMSEKGVTAGFKAAKRQGCKIVVMSGDRIHHRRIKAVGTRPTAL